jgi:hypothetical protein
MHLTLWEIYILQAHLKATQADAQTTAFKRACKN